MARYNLVFTDDSYCELTLPEEANIAVVHIKNDSESTATFTLDLHDSPDGSDWSHVATLFDESDSDDHISAYGLGRRTISRETPFGLYLKFQFADTEPDLKVWATFRID